MFSLLYSAYLTSQLKRTAQPEMVFFGRSNVGKSSLLNAVCNNKSLAKTSKTPGRTASLNFFFNKKYFIVDVPGYGFARTNRNDRLNWEKLILSYLESSENIRRVFLLIDARRGLLTSDFDIINMLEKLELSYQIILTKADSKLGQIEGQAKKEKIVEIENKVIDSLKNNKHYSSPIFSTSSLKGDNIKKLRNYIDIIGRK